MPINAVKDNLLKAKFITKTKPIGASMQAHPNIDMVRIPISLYLYIKFESSGTNANSIEKIVVIPNAKNIQVNTDAKRERSLTIVALSILFKSVFLKLLSILLFSYKVTTLLS
jgi:hypothetical protein